MRKMMAKISTGLLRSLMSRRAGVDEANPQAGAQTRFRRGCGRFVRSESGGPLIEFAFVLPLMMMCLTGIFTFGVAIYNELVLQQATGAGAQFLQTDRGTSDPCAATFSAITSAAPTLKSSNITLSISINGASAVTGSSCTGQSSTLNSAEGEPVTVTTKYPCTLVVYGMNLGGCQLSATVTEYEY
jgi:Flp pilus assembly protein TadG